MKITFYSKLCLYSFLITIITLAFTFIPNHKADKPNVLVFSKTEGFRHSSIKAGQNAFKKMAEEKGFKVEFSEDATIFTTSNLKNYNAIVFLNTTGDILNDEQQSEFERYIQAGGGYVGIHAATDCEYNWPWYGHLAGAFFLNHPNPNNIQKGRFYVVKKDHWATKGMPDSFERTDEFYSFKNIDPTLNVLIRIDESSYQGGSNGDFHPMSWYHDFDGGRAFYTAMGHTDETYSEPLFLNHIWAGLHYAMGGDNPKPLDYSNARPEENRFSKVILKEKLDEPMELSVLSPTRVLFIQRHGAVRLYNTETNELKTIANIPVSTKYTDKEGKVTEAEDGLLGLNKDPHFADNHWIYLYYSAAGDEAKNILTRYTLDGDKLDLNSKKVLLEVPTQRRQCCHTAGSIAWDADGNLYLSTGDNSNPHGSDGYSPSDERPDRYPWDAQKSASNTNDLRGKILRITPKDDGTYDIPKGNLFAVGTARTRPEIYTMGHRNPFRISVDKKTGYVYWGEVGPDANDGAPDRGPAGQDEIGMAKKPGNFGWPYFVGDNKAYNKYDFAKEVSGPKWDPEAPVNTSPNNTGLEKLPPAQKAMIWYPYAESKEFPLVGAGGRNAMAGPVYHKEDFANAENAFPNYYDNKLLIYEWMRGWIMAVTFDKNGNYSSMEKFMPGYRFSNPMDMEFASNGDLYMLEYGTGWFTANDDARLIRIEYNGGNRKPQIHISADKMGGAIPFSTNLSSEGSEDFDGDPLKYSWKITSKNGFNKVVPEPDASLTLTKPGIYMATLTLKDDKGATAEQSLELTAGNEPPVVDFDLGQGNGSFYFPGQTINYQVKINDKEDGSLANGQISPDRVSVTIDYLEEGYDKNKISQGHRTADEKTEMLPGLSLIEENDCKSCHSLDKKSIGPTYRDISQKYTGNTSASEELTKKVIAGGSGVWGEVPMSAHPQLSATDAGEMVKYILHITESGNSSLPTKGTYTFKPAEQGKEQASYILRASYKDKGANGLPGISSEKIYYLRNSTINTHDFDEFELVSKMSFGGSKFVIPSKSGSYIGLKDIDLTGIVKVKMLVSAPKAQLNAQGGTIQLHMDSPDGAMIGESDFITPSDANGFTPSPVEIKVQPTDGQHDIYLSFVNEKAGSGQSLMVVINAEFMNSPAGMSGNTH